MTQDVKIDYGLTASLRPRQSEKQLRYPSLTSKDGSTGGRRRKVLASAILLIFWAAFCALWWQPTWLFREKGCRDTIDHGYECAHDISRHWGQYSPYFSVPPSDSPEDTPEGCEITFVNMLSRHGARHPSARKTKKYRETVLRIQEEVLPWNLRGKYAFLANYEYRLGEGEMTEFGNQQMRNSGTKFYRKYSKLAAKHTPFVRAASKPRVVDSAVDWTKGFHTTKSLYEDDEDFPYDLVVIEEGEEFNNTLDHSRCDAFEHGDYAKIGFNAQQQFIAVFTPPILERLSRDLGLQLSAREAINLMQMCPFDTVADPSGTPSPFCGLFTPAEFRELAYYESLDKYYGFGAGNPLGPSQGVGFANELIARMTGKPVKDDTSTNRTLDGSKKTFPLHKHLYADFSHDNDMTSAFFALGLFNSTPALSKTEVMDEDKTDGFSAAWVVPFGSRAYFEKMRCGESKEELVRVIINDRVVPLHGCGADELGRCTLDRFVASQSFAEAGGRWSECFA